MCYTLQPVYCLQEGHVFDVYITNIGEIAYYRTNHESLDAAELFKFYSLIPLLTASLNG